MLRLCKLAGHRNSDRESKSQSVTELKQLNVKVSEYQSIKVITMTL
jgi:hypothetical protein